MYLRLLAIAIVIICGLIGWRLYSKVTAFDTLAQAPHNQYVGAEKPALTITEIMDYRCPYCRAMHDNMTAFVAMHPEVRVIYRVYPIFGEAAIREAKLAMAAGKQGKFAEMHNKLIRMDKSPTVAEERALVEELGLDKAQFEKDLLSWEATKDLLDTAAAVEALGIKSTPTYIIGKTVYPPQEGLMPTLEDLEARFAPYLKTTKDTAQP